MGRCDLVPDFLLTSDKGSTVQYIKLFDIKLDQQGFAEAKAYKKTRKIYCSTFRGHRDSSIVTMTPKRRAINLSCFFI